MITNTAEIKSLKAEYQGLSTDTKPNTCRDGSTFYELDTKNGFLFDSKNICPTTTTNWWPV